MLILYCAAFIFCLMRIVSHYSCSSVGAAVLAIPYHLRKSKNKTGTIRCQKRCPSYSKRKECGLRIRSTLLVPNA
jgi:hypothetical protein